MHVLLYIQYCCEHYYVSFDVCISVGYIPRSEIAGSYYSLILIDIIRANNNYNNSFKENSEDSQTK